MAKTLHCILLVVLASVCLEAQTLFTPETPKRGDVACPLEPPPSSPTLFTVTRESRPTADKKVRLIELLRLSLRNEATAIDGKRKAPILDLRVEREMRRLASDLSR